MGDRPRDYFRNPRSEMIGFIPENAKKILDVGCGEGFFGYKLKREINAKIWGIEIDRTAAESAQKKLDKVMVGDISKTIIELPDTYFDCVIFNDVLEHLIDPFTILIRIKRKLSKNGLVISSIPNIRYYDQVKSLLLKKEWKYEDSGILDKTHLRFFTKKSILDMFESTGYDILNLCGINPTKSKNYRILNLLLLGSISDMKYLQFACVARPRNMK
jgi:2-polyprenyl-3-methyl-5-hydroxy-6-metoxy-1,4-benzoquinol methylase